ncbi:hypothetical protein [Nibricoccus sp. IMCC34717]|uniref:hypothetical protein n=1 Tax=Nibricoccus sp. IMCC34717 TaxID=3034021 RepID=UPI00385079C7
MTMRAYLKDLIAGLSRAPGLSHRDRQELAEVQRLLEQPSAATPAVHFATSAEPKPAAEPLPLPPAPAPSEGGRV